MRYSIGAMSVMPITLTLVTAATQRSDWMSSEGARHTELCGDVVRRMVAAPSQRTTARTVLLHERPPLWNMELKFQTSFEP